MLLVAKFSSHESPSDIRIDVMTTAMTCKTTIREMIDLNLTKLFLGDEISDAAHGMDLHPGAFIGELLAKPVDIYLDGIRRDV